MDKFSYAMGTLVAQNLKQQGLSEVSVDDLMVGLKDMLEGNEPKVPAQEAQQLIQERLQAAAAKAQAAAAKTFEGNIKEGAEFLKANGEKEGVTVLASGLQYEVLAEGSGESPKPTDEVTTHYHGTLIDGRVFDSSVQRNQPATFPVNGVIPGWTEALQLMKVGSKFRLFVPSNLAYGDRGAGEMIQPFSTLIFEVELLKIN